MKNYKQALCAVMLLASSKSFAVAGSQTHHMRIDPVCRILVRETNQKLKLICSGTLISEKVIATANHCLPEDLQLQNLEVSCGFQGLNSKDAIERTEGGNDVFTSGAIFKEFHLAVERLLVDRPNDTAEIILKNASAITPVKAASAAAVYDAVMGNTLHDCFFAGYGVADDRMAGVLGVATVGKNVAVIFNQGVVSAFRNITPNADIFAEWSNTYGKAEVTTPSQRDAALFLSSNGLLTFAAMAGDSGGPLFCRMSQGGKVMMVGIDRGMGFQTAVTSKASWIVHETDWNILNEKNLVDFFAASASK